MRTPGPAWQHERRRHRAIALLKGGKSQVEVARALSASTGSVSHWWKLYQKRGMAGLRARPTPGRPPKLERKELKQLERLLVSGPRALGYDTDLWTLPLVTQVIRGYFDVQYHPGHVWRILREGLGWSSQKPQRRARQRDEAAILRWKRHRWPHIKKRRADRGPSGV